MALYLYGGVDGKSGRIHLRSGGELRFADFDVDVLDTVRDKDISISNSDVDTILGREGARDNSYPDDNGSRRVASYPDTIGSKLVYCTPFLSKSSCIVGPTLFS